MYTLKIFIAALLLVVLHTGCDNNIKSYANDNTPRPTFPDVNDRNIGNDGTSDKLIDPFYKKKKWVNNELAHKQ
jgi:hypothetical protein